MFTLDELRKELSKPKPSSFQEMNQIGEQRNNDFVLTKKKEVYGKEAQNSSVDRSLFVNLRLRGASPADIKTLEPQKESGSTRAKNEVKKSVTNTLSRISGGIQGFGTIGLTLPRAAMSQYTGGDSFGGSIKKSVGDSVSLFAGTKKPTETNPLMQGLRTVRAVSSAVSAPLAATFAAADKSVTAKQAVAESLKMTEDMLNDPDTNFGDAPLEAAQMYLKGRGVGKYGNNKTTIGDVAILGFLGMSDMFGDVLFGLPEAAAGAKTARELALWKRVAKYTADLPTATSFVKGTTREVEIAIDDATKIKIKPRENSIVIEGYKKRFGQADDLAKNKKGPETQTLLDTIDEMTGKGGISVKYTGDDLVMTPRASEAAVRTPIVEGTGKSLFAPKTALTSEQEAQAIARREIEGDLASSGARQFPDSELEGQYQDFVSILKDKKFSNPKAREAILNGDDTTFKSELVGRGILDKDTADNLFYSQDQSSSDVLDLFKERALKEDPTIMTSQRQADRLGLTEGANRSFSEQNTAEMKEEILSGMREEFRLNNDIMIDRLKNYGVQGLPKTMSPDTSVTFYRAGTGPISPGDAITLDKNLAEKVYLPQREGTTLQTFKAPLKDLVDYGGKGSEFVYAPKETVVKVNTPKPVKSTGKVRESAVYCKER